MALNINGTTGISGVDGSASAPALTGTDSNTGINFASDTVNINTGGVARAIVDSSGRVGIGTTSPDHSLHVVSSGTDTAFFKGRFVRIDGAAASDSPRLNLSLDGTDKASILLNRTDSSLSIETSTSAPMVFQTNNSERLRMLSDGQIFSNGLDGSVDITVSSAADTSDGIQMGKPPFRVTRTSNVPAYLNRNGSGGNIIQFRYGGSVVGSISNNSNSLPSDRNYKKDITNLTLGLDLVNKLQPVSYHYKFDADSDPVMYGLIAQDFETALNDVGVAQNTAAILQYEDKKDEKDSDYSLDYIKLTPILINAVKELSAKVETLETENAKLQTDLTALTARVAALEAG